MPSPAALMDVLAIDAFLWSQPVGVLAMADADDVNAVPVSFGSADEGPALLFRRGYRPDSQMRTFVERVKRATFVVFDRTEVGWKSVVAAGRLERLVESTLDSSVVQAIEGLRIPFFQVHRRPTDELESSTVRLAVDQLSGVATSHRGARVV